MVLTVEVKQLVGFSSDDAPTNGTSHLLFYHALNWGVHGTAIIVLISSHGLAHESCCRRCLLIVTLLILEDSINVAVTCVEGLRLYLVGIAAEASMILLLGPNTLRDSCSSCHRLRS